MHARAQRDGQALERGLLEFSVGPLEADDRFDANWDVDSRPVAGSGAATDAGTRTRYTYLGWDDVARAKTPRGLIPALAATWSFYRALWSSRSGAGAAAALVRGWRLALRWRYPWVLHGLDYYLRWGLGLAPELDARLDGFARSIAQEVHALRARGDDCEVLMVGHCMGSSMAPTMLDRCCVTLKREKERQVPARSSCSRWPTSSPW